MKKGFTLIELLAVIVILAIIAVIAVPIVLNIIEETKNNATLRSAEFYLKGVELSIAQSVLKGQNIEDKSYDILENGNICLEYTDDVCTEELVIEVNGTKPNGGTITIQNGNITEVNILLNDKSIIKNADGELVFNTDKSLDTVCKHISGTEKTAGAKYECKVDPTKKPYTFYVLTTPKTEDTTINLIMDRNINSDGTPVTKAISKLNPENGVYNLVEWISREDFLKAGGTIADWDTWNGIVKYGPLTAMNFLEKATKNWINTNEIITDSFAYGFGSYRINMHKSYNTHARMLDKYDNYGYYSENYEYLYEYLDYIDDYVYVTAQGIGINTNHKIDGIHGYWTNISSFYAPNYNNANFGDETVDVVEYYGQLSAEYAGNYSQMGIRPVINLDL